MSRSKLRLPAVRVEQSPGQLIYATAVDGKHLERFAAISRVHRDDEHHLVGYQRPEVLSHVAAIRKYLESGQALLPNALVVAFDQRVTFSPARSGPRTAWSTVGTLVIPVDDDWDEAEKPGWIVDGQQRSAAIRDSDLIQFPVFITAFITDDIAEQRAQFILVNSTKPLPKGLIHELLPETAGPLPAALAARQRPAALLSRLNFDDDSPLQGRIKSPTAPTGYIQDTAIMTMIANSLSDGVLHQFRDGPDAEDRMVGWLKTWWSAVALAYGDAWTLPPRRSRLSHGAGIVALGLLMDTAGEHHGGPDAPDVEVLADELRLVGQDCAWTSGTWELPSGSRRWNQIQNTPNDQRELVRHLLRSYRARVINAPAVTKDGRKRGKNAKPGRTLKSSET